MPENAYIKLVPSALKQIVSIEDIKELFHYYKEITRKTGNQLNWQYESASFPYEIVEKEEGKGKWFLLSSSHDGYNAILVGIDMETYQNANGDEIEQVYIQVTLPEESTHGDKGKANEFCKFMAKKFQGELHLFNGRIMYYYPRK